MIYIVINKCAQIPFSNGFSVYQNKEIYISQFAIRISRLGLLIRMPFLASRLPLFTHFFEALIRSIVNKVSITHTNILPLFLSTLFFTLDIASATIIYSSHTRKKATELSAKSEFNRTMTLYAFKTFGFANECATTQLNDNKILNCYLNH